MTIPTTTMTSEKAKENLLSHTDARLRSSQNQQKILQFLRQEKYTKRAILQSLLPIKTACGLLKLLRKMEHNKLLKKHDVSEYVTLWGITKPGLSVAVSPEEDRHNDHYFAPSKVNINMLPHTFGCQMVHALCMKYRVEYRAGRTMGSRAEMDKIPDGILYTPRGNVAIEVERHLKTRQRYDAIIYHYLKCIKAGKYHLVVYVCPDADKRDQLHTLFYSLKTITMNLAGKIVKTKLDADTHLKYFRFIAEEQLPGFVKRIASIKP